MYPFLRVAAAMLRARRQPSLAPGETHVVRTRCWPWDIDPFLELNNGRTLSLMDIGRLSLAQRSGLIDALRANGWGLTMAGVAVQYRRRVTPFAPMEIRSRVLGRDARFFYIEQLTLTRGTAAHHAVYRGAIVGPGGIVPPGQVSEAMGMADWDPPLPPWVAAWAAAEAERPWPPTI